MNKGALPLAWSVALLFCMVMYATAWGQTPGLGSWNLVNARYHVSERWKLFGEAQLRSLAFYQDYHYHEVKGGASYRIRTDLIATLAAGNYVTYREGGDFLRPKNNDELRIWPQLVNTSAIGRLQVEHRYRAELRFTSTGYRNRFRYRLGLGYALGRKDRVVKPYQLQGSCELFFTDSEPYFERIRSQVAINRRISPSLSAQVGYLHQFDYRILDETGRDFLVIGLYFEIRRGSASPTKQGPVERRRIFP